MKHLISIIGNICSGKSTVSNELLQHIPYRYIAIDDYRRRLNAVNLERELKAWTQLKSDIIASTCVILESSGTSLHMPDIYQSFDGSITIVKLVVPLSVLITRIETRLRSNYQIVPFCWRDNRETIYDSVFGIEHRLKTVQFDLSFDSSLLTPDAIALQLITALKKKPSDH